MPDGRAALCGAAWTVYRGTAQSQTGCELRLLTS